MSIVWIISFIGWLVSAGWFIFKMARREGTITPLTLAWVFVAIMFITK